MILKLKQLIRRMLIKYRFRKVSGKLEEIYYKLGVTQ